MSREAADCDELLEIVRKMTEELRQAYHRTSPRSSSWIHVRNAYLLALSLERALGGGGRKNKIPRPHLRK